MVKVVRINDNSGWHIMANGMSHGSFKNEIKAKRFAVEKINSLIKELEGDRKRLTDEILALT